MALQYVFMKLNIMDPVPQTMNYWELLEVGHLEMKA